MAEDRFKIRFLQPNEAGRLSELIGGLHAYQDMEGVTEVPSEEDLKRYLIHLDEDGKLVTNIKGTFVAVAIDKSKEADDNKYQHLVGYLIYSQSYSIMHGRQMYISSFFVEDAYRRHGLGNKFMTFLRLHAKLLGADRTDVPCRKVNYVGLDFYKKFGAYMVNYEYQLYSMSVYK